MLCSNMHTLLNRPLVHRHVWCDEQSKVESFMGGYQARHSDCAGPQVAPLAAVSKYLWGLLSSWMKGRKLHAWCSSKHHRCVICPLYHRLLLPQDIDILFNVNVMLACTVLIGLRIIHFFCEIQSNTTLYTFVSPQGSSLWNYWHTTVKYIAGRHLL